jgi:hypothetical protein
MEESLREARMKCTNMPHKVQIEVLVDTDGPTKIVGVSLPKEIDEVGCSTITFAGLYSFGEFLNKNVHALAVPNIDVQVVQQNPYEHESYIAKLSARKKIKASCVIPQKVRLRASTIRVEI